METYTLSLALEDFVPVILSSLGLWFISQMVASIDAKLGKMALVAWLLITIGGLFKATWKLIMALTDGQTDVVFFDKGLFVWLSVGFILMSYAVSYTWRIVYNRNPRSRIWLWPLVPIVLQFGGAIATGFPDPAINTWRFILLGMMTIGNVVLAILLIAQARRQKQSLVALLFLLNIIAVFLLSGLARIPDQSIALQWIEQSLNTIGQAAFCYAALKLSGGMVEARGLAIAS